MCGIFGYIGRQKSDLSGFLLDGLSKLEYRGYDSAGISILQGGKLRIYKEVGDIKKLEKLLTGVKISGGLGIGHTRWATHRKVQERMPTPKKIVLGV